MWRYGRTEGKAGGDQKLIAGPDYQKCLNEYDVVFKSPGVVLEKPVQSYSSQILSQTELFFQCFRDQIIGITGTKGKSTITTLIYHLLKEAGMDTILVGNIGIPVFDHMEEVGEDTKIVCELSCHQLELYDCFSCILESLPISMRNIWITMEHWRNIYRQNCHIYLNQKEEDVLICNVQCLPEPGTCRSKLIAAKPSFEEPVFQIPEYLVRELFQKKWSISGKKWKLYRKMILQRPDMTAIPLKFLYPRSAF